MPDHPVVAMQLKLNQLFIAHFLEVHPRRSGLVVNHLEDASVRTVMTGFIIMMALVFIVPIDDVNRPVLIVQLIEGLGPCIVEVQKIASMPSNETGPAANRNVHVQPLAMNVSHE